MCVGCVLRVGCIGCGGLVASVVACCMLCCVWRTRVFCVVCINNVFLSFISVGWCCVFVFVFVECVFVCIVEHVCFGAHVVFFEFVCFSSSIVFVCWCVCVYANQQGGVCGRMLVGARFVFGTLRRTRALGHGTWRRPPPLVMCICSRHAWTTVSPWCSVVYRSRFWLSCFFGHLFSLSFSPLFVAVRVLICLDCPNLVGCSN